MCNSGFFRMLIRGGGVDVNSGFGGMLTWVLRLCNSGFLRMLTRVLWDVDLGFEYV